MLDTNTEIKRSVLGPWVVRAVLVAFTALCLTAGVRAGAVDFAHFGWREAGATIMVTGLTGFLLATWPRTRRFGGSLALVCLWALLTASSLSAIIDPQPATELTSRRTPDTEWGVRVLHSLILAVVNSPLIWWARRLLMRHRTQRPDGHVET